MFLLLPYDDSNTNITNYFNKSKYLFHFVSIVISESSINLRFGKFIFFSYVSSMIESYNNKSHTNKIITDKASKHVWNKSRDFINKGLSNGTLDEKFVAKVYKLCLLNGMNTVK